MSAVAGAGAGREALARIDRALAMRPRRDGATLTAAVQNLAAFRDGLAARQRGEGGTRWRAPLERANAVLSIVLAAEFPIGEAPWGELEKARGWLDDLLREADGSGAGPQ